MINTAKYATEIKNANKEISDFFGFNLENIEIKIAENRTEYEKLLGRKTADWEVGNSQNGKTIILINPKQWHKEAPTHKPEEFLSIVKHELTHIYTNHLSKDRSLPKWLSEGLAGAVSRQYKTAKVKYFETDFCGKIDTPHNWSQRVNSGAYPTAYLFTHYLIDKYGFKSIEKLIQTAPIYYSYNRFDKIVTGIFGKNLTELEQEFLNSLQ